MTCACTELSRDAACSASQLASAAHGHFYIPRRTKSSKSNQSLTDRFRTGSVLGLHVTQHTVSHTLFKLLTVVNQSLMTSHLPLIFPTCHQIKGWRRCCTILQGDSGNVLFINGYVLQRSPTTTPNTWNGTPEQPLPQSLWAFKTFSVLGCGGSTL